MLFLIFFHHFFFYQLVFHLTEFFFGFPFSKSSKAKGKGKKTENAETFILSDIEEDDYDEDDDEDEDEDAVDHVNDIADEEDIVFSENVPCPRYCECARNTNSYLVATCSRYVW